ncbi:unnamed protein product [Trichobilharzia regenti]|nr:unnamed protein product [Trichobilharzia regenti]
MLVLTVLYNLNQHNKHLTMTIISVMIVKTIILVILILNTSSNYTFLVMVVFLYNHYFINVVPLP